MKTFLILLCMISATLAAARQAPPGNANPNVNGNAEIQKAPAPVLPAIDADSNTTLAAIATQIIQYQTQERQLQAQMQTLNVFLKPLGIQWRISEGKALANASLDPAMYAVTVSETPKFVLRPGGLRP